MMVRKLVIPQPLKVMISSQCKSTFPEGNRCLTEIRQELRDRIEAQEIFGQKVFKVWINEDAPPAGTEEDSWETCLSQVRDADILLVLDSGNAGWTKGPGEIGICHAELMTAHDSAPAKVRIVRLEGASVGSDEDVERNRRFRAALNLMSAFSSPVSTEKALFSAAQSALTDAVVKLAHLGVREARKGNFHSGDALTWSRLNYVERGQRMSDVLKAALVESGGSAASERHVLYQVSSGKVGFTLHAAPAGLGVPTSREIVGRPFHDDHTTVGAFPKGVGPIHLIACQAGATEAQARALLGFPDATIVRPPFGVFAADEVQQIQFALLKDCRDETTTRHAVQRFLEWLRQSGEDARVIERAGKRRKIADVIAKQAGETSNE